MELPVILRQNEGRFTLKIAGSQTLRNSSRLVAADVSPPTYIPHFGNTERTHVRYYEIAGRCCGSAQFVESVAAGRSNSPRMFVTIAGFKRLLKHTMKRLHFLPNGAFLIGV